MYCTGQQFGKSLKEYRVRGDDLEKMSGNFQGLDDVRVAQWTNVIFINKNNLISLTPLLLWQLQDGDNLKVSIWSLKHDNMCVSFYWPDETWNKC